MRNVGKTISCCSSWMAQRGVCLLDKNCCTFSHLPCIRTPICVSYSDLAPYGALDCACHPISNHFLFVHLLSTCLEVFLRLSFGHFWNYISLLVFKRTEKVWYWLTLWNDWSFTLVVCGCSFDGLLVLVMQRMVGSMRFWVAFRDFIEDVAFRFLFGWVVGHIEGLT